MIAFVTGVGLGVAIGEPNNGTGPLSSDSPGLGVGLGIRQKVIRVRGSQENVNVALNGMLFYSDSHYRGPASVTIFVSDLGYTDSSFSESLSLVPLVLPPGASSGRGSPSLGEGALTHQVTIPIIVLPVNQLPVWVVPPNATSLVTEEDVELNIIGVGVIDDVDTLQYTLYSRVSVGSVTFNDSLPLNYTVGTGVLDRVTVASGTLVDINRALAHMTYVPKRHFDTIQNHRDYIELTILDNPAAGRGPVGGHNVTTVIYITRVLGVNNPPYITTPGQHQVQLPCEQGPDPVENVNVTCKAVYTVDNIDVFEDVPYTIPVSISDVDIEYTYASALAVTVSSSFGLLSLGPIAGVTFDRGDGVTDPIIQFRASLTATNHALAGLTYVSGLNYYGSDNITITVSDQGFSGRGGPGWDLRTIPLTVWPVNDPVMWSMPVWTPVSDQCVRRVLLSLVVWGLDVAHVLMLWWVV